MKPADQTTEQLLSRISHTERSRFEAFVRFFDRRWRWELKARWDDGRPDFPEIREQIGQHRLHRVRFVLGLKSSEGAA